MKSTKKGGKYVLKMNNEAYKLWTFAKFLSALTILYITLEQLEK
ncbi:hypothetical protein [Zobellia sp. 1_MG-2023]|nr:hypothetical protein [Zobellia sp. 1_MG-2023]MDO6819527.1 hypothetical protein [Zobellia sp. 1_MG-2023]